MNKPKKFYTYCYKLYYTYRTKYTKYNNDYNGKTDNPWHMWEEWAIFIGFDNRIFEMNRDYYDGHTTDYITILGFIIGRMYSYEAEPVNK